MTPADLNIMWAPDLLVVAQEFAVNASIYYATFISAWSKVAHSSNCPYLSQLILFCLILCKVMNADRFDGPYSNLCDAAAASPDSDNSSNNAVYSQAQVMSRIDWDVLSTVTAHAFRCSLLEVW
jgi:hypothetical protein